MTQKETIIQLLKSTRRRGIESLLLWMDENGFYDAPCSSKYHLAEPGGLAEHSLNVYRIAIDFGRMLFSQFTPDLIDSVVICSLLHDLGKTGQHGKPNYILNDDYPFPVYETNKNLLYVPHEIRSIAIASQFIELTEEEQFAILHHNGLYGELESIKNKETPLQMIIHFADMWACRVIEK